MVFVLREEDPGSVRSLVRRMANKDPERAGRRTLQC